MVSAGKKTVTKLKIKKSKHFFSLTLQEGGDILELRNVVFRVAAVLFQKGQDAVELCAGVGLEQLLQVPVDGFPRGHLDICVLDARDLFSTTRQKCQ